MRTSAPQSPAHTCRLVPRRRLVAAALLALAAAGLVGVVTAPAAGASTITVTTAADEVITNGACSLREALSNADADADADPLPDCAPGNGADTITFELDPPGVITLQPVLQRLHISDADGLTIDGAGTTLSGGGLMGLIRVSAGAVAVLERLTFVDSTTDADEDGGAVVNFGTLTIRDSVFSRLQAPVAGSLGGAITSRGADAQLTVSGSTFTDNTAFSGGAIGLDATSASVSNSTFHHNRAVDGPGGAIAAVGGGGALVYNTFFDNGSDGEGGAVSGAFTAQANVLQGNLAASGSTCSSSVVDLGYNVSSDASCATAATSIGLTRAGLNEAPRFHGGPTPTIALAADSPAVDLMPVGADLCPATGSALDQRGFQRPADGDLDGTSRCDAGAFERNAVTPVDRTPPVLSVPADQQVEASSSSGTVVEFSATAVDEKDGPLIPACTPASGSTFALGSTQVECTARDTAGNTATAWFLVMVVDTQAPVLSGTSDLTAPATGPDGAVVTYAAPTAADTVDGSVVPTCSPASGKSFPVGTTTVVCTATDTAGNTGTASFTVTVTPAPVADEADLEVTITGPSSARRGGVVTYRTTVTNTGPATATNLVTVVGGAGLSLTATTPATGSGTLEVESRKLAGARWTAGTLASGASLSYVLTGKVTAKSGQTITVAAGTLSAVPDPRLASNVATTATKVS